MPIHGQILVSSIDDDPLPTVCGFRNVTVCTSETSPCVPATRGHVSTHVRVVPAHTGTFRMYTRWRFWTHTRVFFQYFKRAATHTQTHGHTHTKHTTTTKQHHDHNDTLHTTQHTTSHGDRERGEDGRGETRQEKRSGEQTRDKMQKKREERRQDKRRDQESRQGKIKKREDDRGKWKENFFFKIMFQDPQTRQMNYPWMFWRKISVGRIIPPFFLRKFLIWPCFHLLTWFEFDFSGPGNKFRMSFGAHSIVSWKDPSKSGIQWSLEEKDRMDHIFSKLQRLWRNQWRAHWIRVEHVPRIRHVAALR